jgi:predicted transcriptional regulator
MKEFNSFKVHGINKVKMTYTYSTNTANNVVGQK